MNRQELAEAFVKEHGVSRAEALRIIDTFVQTVTKTVAKGGDVRLVGFGTFSSVKRAARNARNPMNGETVKVPARKVPKFSAGATFKAAVNKKGGR